LARVWATEPGFSYGFSPFGHMMEFGLLATVASGLISLGHLKVNIIHLTVMMLLLYENWTELDDIN